MPELPEVETVKRGISPVIKSLKIDHIELNRDGLRIPFPSNMSEVAEGSIIDEVGRRSKYLLLDMDNGWTIVVHLGMSGRFTIEDEKIYEHKKHDHVLIRLENGVLLVLNDPRRFGLMTTVKSDELDSHKLFSSLAPEPFSDDFNSAYLSPKLLRRKSPIKQVLMDSHVVVGVGNIYASEVLYRSKIHPASIACNVADYAEILIENIREVLAEAIESGGSTLRDFVGANSNAGYFQHRFDVYDREGEPCKRCDGVIEKITQAGRSSFFCSKCQPVIGNI